jgi:hypothetical protein
VKSSWTKGGAGLVICRIMGWRIQKSIVDGTKEESDFDESCHSECSEESDGAYEQAAVSSKRGFLLNRDSSLRSE